MRRAREWIENYHAGRSELDIYFGVASHGLKRLHVGKKKEKCKKQDLKTTEVKSLQGCVTWQAYFPNPLVHSFLHFYPLWCIQMKESEVGFDGCIFLFFDTLYTVSCWPFAPPVSTTPRCILKPSLIYLVFFQPLVIFYQTLAQTLVGPDTSFPIHVVSCFLCAPLKFVKIVISQANEHTPLPISVLIIMYSFVFLLLLLQYCVHIEW